MFFMSGLGSKSGSIGLIKQVQDGPNILGLLTVLTYKQPKITISKAMKSICEHTI